MVSLISESWFSYIYYVTNVEADTVVHAFLEVVSSRVGRCAVSFLTTSRHNCFVFIYFFVGGRGEIHIEDGTRFYGSDSNCPTICATLMCASMLTWFWKSLRSSWGRSFLLKVWFKNVSDAGLLRHVGSRSSDDPLNAFQLFQ